MFTLNRCYSFRVLHKFSAFLLKYTHIFLLPLNSQYFSFLRNLFTTNQILIS